MRKGDLITKKNAQNAYFSSFEGKYIIMDNLDEKSEPIIMERDEIYNADYVYVTMVLRGTLHLTVGGADLDVKANEFLAVMPCMSVKVKESRCTFFCFLTLSYITGDIYARTQITNRLHFHAFKFRHLHLGSEKTAILLECYKRIKREHMREDYPMKEVVLRAYQCCYLAKLFSFNGLDDMIVKCAKRTNRQYLLFNDFIHRLDEMHKQERSVQYYAKEMEITPKYLSAIVNHYTGLTASQVIDQYVVFSIKQHLYMNNKTIKEMSDDFNFPSQSFFGRYFKRIAGMSPNYYIKQHNIKSINFL